MSKKESRFVINKSDSSFTSNAFVVVDKKTGVNYLFVERGYAGGLTPLLDAQGNPIVTSVSDLD